MRLRIMVFQNMLNKYSIAGCLLILTFYSAKSQDSYFQQDAGSDGVVCVDAENYTAKTNSTTHSWNIVTDITGYNGTGQVRAEPDNGACITNPGTAASPRLDYAVNFTTTGTYYVWLRGYKVSGNDDSYHIGLDGIPGTNSCNIYTNPTAQWSWATKNAINNTASTITVTTTGIHTFNLWMREDGARVDKIILTLNSGYIPAGNGPSQSEFNIATPQTTVASRVSSVSFTANWNSMPGAMEYYLDLSTSNTFSSFVSGYSGKVVTVNTADVTGLAANTTYYYRIRAKIAGAVSANSNIATVTTLNSIITSQPADVKQCPGTSATFSVVANGTGLNYQWRKGGVSITGATSSSYTISSIAAANAGSYDVIVTSGGTTYNSSAATLTVYSLPAIITPPTNLSLPVGSSATFSVGATGSGLTYQWRRNSVNIFGATAPSYTLNNISYANQLSYDVVVTGTCGSVTSAKTTLCIKSTAIRDAYSIIQAERMDDQLGLSVYADGFGDYGSGDWARYDNVDFGTGANMVGIAVGVASAGNRKIELRLDSLKGTLIGAVSPKVTGAWNTFIEQFAKISGATGIHTLYLICPTGFWGSNMDWLRFYKSTITINTKNLGTRYNYTLSGNVVDSVTVFESGALNSIDLKHDTSSVSLNQVIASFTSKDHVENFQIKLMVTHTGEIRDVLSKVSGNYVALNSNFFTISGSEINIGTGQNLPNGKVHLEGVLGVTKVPNQNITVIGTDQYSNATLVIYNSKNRVTPLRTVTGTLIWDGKDSNGTNVVAGVYILSVHLNDGSGKVLNNQVIIK